jgi:hypothetical protein
MSDMRLGKRKSIVIRSERLSMTFFSAVQRITAEAHGRRDAVVNVTSRRTQVNRRVDQDVLPDCAQ